MTDLYCPFIWKELFIENDGFISPCFSSTNNLVDTNIKNHDGKKANVSQHDVGLHLLDLEKMRGEMSQGKWPKQCVNCRAKESKNLLSARQKAVEKYNNIQDTTVELKKITFRVGNICNLRCIMCGPWASNQWYDDYVELNDSSEFKNNQNTYQLEKNKNKYTILRENLNADNWESVIEVVKSNISTLEKISFHGGEPLVSKIHYKILDFLIKSGYCKNVELEYHTNLYQVPAKFFNDISLFKHTTVHVSLDGVGDINDAIRWPSKYSKIIENIEIIKQCANVTIGCNHTISNLNFEHVTEFLEVHGSLGVSLNFVSKPLYTSVKLFDADNVEAVKKHLKNKNKNIYREYNLDSLIDSALGVGISEQQKTYYRKLYIKMWDQFSKKQNQNWSELFPISYEFYKTWSNQ